MNLLLFLSDRCNMACDYCFLSLNRGSAVTLELKAAQNAVLDHLSRDAKGRRSFTLLGGEPFIHYSLIKSIVSYIHAHAKDPISINVVTNGTMVCPKKIKELQNLGAEITVSLDGRDASHDGHRRLLGASGESALKASLASLENSDKNVLRVNMVVGEDTAASLMSNVEFLRSSGFRRLSFHLNILQDWSRLGLETLEKTLSGFVRYYDLLRTGAPGELEITHLESFAGMRADHSYEDIVLGADGRYYPCDSFFVLPYRQLDRWAVGDALSGVDWVKRKIFHRQAKDFIHAQMERHYSCPRETYFHALCVGRDPAAAVRAFHRADNILGDALARLAALKGTVPA